MGTPITGMAVTVTLVFADESHREAWLVERRLSDATWSVVGSLARDSQAPEIGVQWAPKDTVHKGGRPNAGP